MAQSKPNETGKALSISKLSSAKDFQKKFDICKNARNSLDQQWKVNLRFYKGDQYVYYNRHADRIEALPTDPAEIPRYRVRLVSNQIVSGAHSLLAKFTKTKPVITASPGSGSDHDLKAAQMSERLLEYWWDYFNLDNKLEEALLWAIITGQGFWKITWDDQAGTPMRFLMSPDGQPIVDEQLKDMYRNELQKLGIDPKMFEQVAYLGDVRIDAVSPFFTYLDPSARQFEDCKYVFCIDHYDPDEVKNRFGVELSPDSISSPDDISLPYRYGENEPEKNVVKIYHAYFKPSPAIPDGRYVCWSEQKEELLKDDKWPYPSPDLPIVKFPGLRVPGQVYDTSVVEQAIPIQKELNRTLSQIVEYKNLTITPQWRAPVGSMQTKKTNEPGAVFEYVPIGGMQPEPIQLPSMPPYVFELLATESKTLKEIFNSTEVSEGRLPPNLEAGVAIDLLQEMSADQVSPTIKLIETAMERAGQLMLTLAQEYYVEPRLLKIKGSGGSTQVKRFSQADIAGGVTVNVETGSGLPRTRAGRQQRILSFIEAGIIRPDQAYKYLDLADLKSLAKQWEADEEQAYREHEKIMQGIPINEVAYQGAVMLVQSGQPNPETQRPFQSQEEAMEFIHQAALQPVIGESLGTHRDVHALLIKSPEFDNLPPEVKKDYIVHFQLTEQELGKQAPTPEPEAPRVTLQIKGTTGPTGAAAILNKAGVAVTPDVMAEPPLETWVTDSMDKPDMDEAANDPYTQLDEQMLSALTASKAAVELADSSKKVQRADETHEDDMEARALKREEQEAKIRLAEAKIQATKQAAKQKAKSPSKKGS